MLWNFLKLFDDIFKTLELLIVTFIVRILLKNRNYNNSYSYKKIEIENSNISKQTVHIKAL